MKVLISAFACEPGSGSENGVGWHWVMEVSRLGHEVWVLTRAVNRPAIERARAAGGVPGNVHFLYYDLPYLAETFDGYNLTVYPYYLLWQWNAYRLARTVHAVQSFDLVHHVT